MSWDLPLGVNSLRRHAGSYNLEHITFELSITLLQRSTEVHTATRGTAKHTIHGKDWVGQDIFCDSQNTSYDESSINCKHETELEIKTFSHVTRWYFRALHRSYWKCISSNLNTQFLNTVTREKLSLIATSTATQEKEN